MTREVMMQLFVQGPTWDGDLVSKSERDDLVDDGFCNRADGWNFLTAEGVRVAASAGRLEAKSWADQRWYRKAANLGPLPKAPPAPPVPPEPVTKASLLDAAKAAVADRGLNYGKPEDNFRRIADLWNVYLNGRAAGPAAPITPVDQTIMMVLMKVARLQNTPTHLDSWTDLAGYAACGAEITNG